MLSSFMRVRLSRGNYSATKWIVASSFFSSLRFTSDHRKRGRGEEKGGGGRRKGGGGGKTASVQIEEARRAKNYFRLLFLLLPISQWDPLLSKLPQVESPPPPLFLLPLFSVASWGNLKVLSFPQKCSEYCSLPLSLLPPPLTI